MHTLEAFQAKTHFFQLLNKVEQKGETIAITRQGHVIALLVPALIEDPVALAIDSIRKNRQGVTLGKSLKPLIKKGRF